MVNEGQDGDSGRTTQYSDLDNNNNDRRIGTYPPVQLSSITSLLVVPI